MTVRNASSARTTPAVGQDMPPQRTVLIVEDDRDTASLFADALTLEGYFAVAVDDGAEALRISQAIRFDCVVLDWKLNGGISGEEVLAGLRAGTHIPVVVVSAGDLSGVEADRLLHKPFGLDELASCVSEAIDAGYRARGPNGGRPS